MSIRTSWVRIPSRAPRPGCRLAAKAAASEAAKRGFESHRPCHQRPSEGNRQTSVSQKHGHLGSNPSLGTNHRRRSSMQSNCLVSSEVPVRFEAGGSINGEHCAMASAPECDSGRVGSIPTVLPNRPKRNGSARLCEGRGRRFESFRAGQFTSAWGLLFASLHSPDPVDHLSTPLDHSRTALEHASGPLRYASGSGECNSRLEEPSAWLNTAHQCAVAFNSPNASKRLSGTYRQRARLVSPPWCAALWEGRIPRCWKANKRRFSSVAERRPHKPEVASSTLAIATLAQLGRAIG